MNWAVTVRYAAPGDRPRHPSPQHFRRRTVVGPTNASTIEAVFDLLEVPEEMRARIRAEAIVRDFVEGRLVPDQSYRQHAIGMRYVSAAPDAQLVEWSIEFEFVTQIIDQGDFAQTVAVPHPMKLGERVWAGEIQLTADAIEAASPTSKS